MVKKMVDVLIIGGGISAHTSAIYAARATLDTLVVSEYELDQLSTTTLVENFPGFPEGVMGPELIKNCKKQAEKFGAKYVRERVKEIKKIKGGFEVKADKTYSAKTVIIATGARAKTLNVPGKDKYFGKGVAVCATCDAALYRGKIAAIIGGGDAAMEDALALSKFAKQVIIVHRRGEFRASKIMVDRIKKDKKIKVVWNSGLKEIKGNQFVSSMVVEDVKTGKETELKLNGVFFAIGHVPNTEFVKKLVKLDKKGYILASRKRETSVSGIFAAGDVQDTQLFWQAITAAGSGCEAALSAQKYTQNLKQ